MAVGTVGRRRRRGAFRAAAGSLAAGFRPQGTALLAPLVALALITFSGCSYLESGLKQAGLMQRYREAPSQRLYKHMLSSSTFFVFGRVENGSGLNPQATALLAISDRHRQGEVVDVSVSSSCPYDAAGRQSVERAIYKASPLPYAGFETVFNRNLVLNFVAEDR